MTGIFQARDLIPGDRIMLNHEERTVENKYGPRADTGEVLISFTSGSNTVLPGRQNVTVTRAAQRPTR